MWIRDFAVGIVFGTCAVVGQTLAGQALTGQERADTPAPAAAPAPTAPAPVAPPSAPPAGPRPNSEPAEVTLVPAPATVAPPPAAPATGAPAAASPAPPVARVVPTDRSSSPAGVITPKFQPQSVTVTLLNGSTMSGTLGEIDQWQMKTSLGTTNIPVSAVAGVRMAQEGNATTTVVLHNGDTITGALQLDHVAIQTDWGRAEIYGTHVTSVLFTPGLKWTSEPGLNGTRWKLITDDSRTPPSTASVTATNAAAPAAGSPTASAPAAPQPVRTSSVSGPPRGVVPTRGRP